MRYMRSRRKRIRRGGGAYSPSNEAGNILWLDSSDSNTITEVLGAVSQWDDKSGQGNHAVQATGAEQPTTNATTQNGKNVLDFDGTDDRIVSTFGSTLTQPNTVFITGKYDVITAAYMFDGIDASNRNALFNDTSLFTAFAGSSLQGDAMDTDFHVLEVIFNGVSSSIRLDAGTATTGDAGADSLTGLTIGSRYSGTSALDGSIGEALVYNGLLDTAAKARVNTYLMNGWGVS